MAKKKVTPAEHRANRKLVGKMVRTIAHNAHRANNKTAKKNRSK